MADTNQILRLAAIIREVDGNHSKGAAALAESILDHPGFRVVLASWGTSNLTQTKLSPAAGEVVGLVKMLKGIAYWRLHGTDKPTPFDIRQAARLTRAAELLQRQVLQPPADGEVVEVVEWLHTVVAAYKSCRNTDHIWSLSGNGVNARLTVTLLTRAADLLERQATACAICERERLHQSTRAADLEVERQAAPVPVPVNERLPEPEDCDAEGRCWFGTPGCNVWGASWVLRKRSHQRNGITSWLPAHALPLPEVGED